jgi:hypothetical protein
MPESKNIIKPENKISRKMPIKAEKRVSEEKVPQIEKPKPVEVKSEEVKKQEKKEGIKDINEFMAKKNEIKKYL